MLIKKVTVRKMKMRMKEPFATSFGTMQDKQFLLLEVEDEMGNAGWGSQLLSMPRGIQKKQLRRIYI